MARKKKKVPGINGASSADIAFMLLLFFLLTTSMDTDQGLPRKLPNPPDKEKPEDIKVKERNILKVMVSQDNRIMCGDEQNISFPRLREKAKEFIENPTNDDNLPEKELVDVPFFGERMITKNHIISLQCDRTTQYQTYIDVQNELAAAYNELRDDACIKQFGKVFKALEDEEQRNAVMQVLYPQKISEAEPKDYGQNKKK